MFENIKKNDKDLIKSSDKIQKGIFSIFSGKKLDNDTLEKLEELLISSDLSMEIVDEIITFIKSNRYSSDTNIDDIKNIIFSRLNVIIKSNEVINFDFLNKKPCVLLFLGVNGSGKTTIIGKIANKLKKNGKKVLLAACDTFRAGAVEQLKEWSKKANVDIFASEKEKEDPASLAYKSYEKAKNENYDVLLIDTAGRLQNNINLMNELSKIERVLKKQDENLPHQTILVLDATIGQNSYKQFEAFKESVNVNSIIMNKLDGTAKGGILLSIIKQFKKPIFAIGVGENIDSIKGFDGEEFLKNLLGM